MLSSRFYWIFICGNKPAKLVAPGPGLQAWTLDRQLLHLIFWKNIENIIITYWIFGMFELAIKTLKMKLRLKLSNKFRRSTNMHCTLQVILCHINIFCHQLTQHMKNDFVRFTQIVLKFKTCKTCVLNFITIFVNLRRWQNQSLYFGDKICWSNKEQPVPTWPFSP